ncbi:MAG: hypothetical protein K2O17_04620, partial [Bacteroidaceae bacterium]|nr:hypothetical protein [Bacteroidaceae bacterium]
PTSSLDEIQLKNIMNLEDDGVVQLVRVPDPDDPTKKDSIEIYVVSISGEPDIEPIKIDEIRITKPVVSDFKSDVSIDSPQSMPKHKTGKNYAKISIAGFNFQDATYLYPITSKDASQEITPTSTDGISSDVETIDSVRIKPVEVILAINTNFPDYLRVHLDNFTLTYPKELNIKSCEFDGTPARIDKDKGRIYITAPKDEDSRSLKEITLKMVIEGIETGEHFTFENQTATLKGGTIKVDGTFRIETKDLEKGIPELERLIEDKLKEDPGIIDPSNPQLNLYEIGIIPPSIELNGVTTFSDDFVITEVTGTFQHAIGDIKPLSLSDLPDFLTSEKDSIVLDLYNPMICLSITNELPAEIKTHLTLMSDTDNNTPHSTDDLTIKSGINKYYLAEIEDSKHLLPKDYQDAKWEKVDSLSNLIKHIPDSITIDVATVKLNATNLDITSPYNIDIKYEVYAPLMFGKDFKLVYTDTDKGWNLGDDYDYLDAECISLKANISSTLPASMTLRFDLLNAQGHKIDIIEDNEIPSFKADEKTPFEIKIKAKPGHSLKEILSPGANQLDGIRYTAKLDAPKVGLPLQDNAEIKISDIQLSLQGVVTIEIK